VYESQVLQQRFLFTVDEALSGSLHDFVSALQQSTTFYILDDANHSHCQQPTPTSTHFAAMTILLTSPRVSVWYPFSKMSCAGACACAVLYMPVWTYAEMVGYHELKQLQSPSSVVVSRDNIDEGYYRWGGNAWYVLDAAQVQVSVQVQSGQQVQLLLLQTALGTISSVEQMVHVCRSFDRDDTELSHLLLHCHVDDRSFVRKYVFWSSKYVQQCIYKTLVRYDKEELYRFLATTTTPSSSSSYTSYTSTPASSSRPSSLLASSLTLASSVKNDEDDDDEDEFDDCLAVLRAQLFEEHVHAVLTRGGTFRVRHLTKGHTVHADSKNTASKHGLYEYRYDKCVDGKSMQDTADVVIDNAATAMAKATATATSEIIAVLPKRKVVMCNNNDDVKDAADNVYLRASVGNVYFVDALIKPDTMFRVMGVHKQPLNRYILSDMMRLMGDPTTVCVYFVVPPEQFDSFMYQRYLDEDDADETDAAHCHVDEIHQYVLEVDPLLHSLACE
jgi:hypothetical protein